MTRLPVVAVLTVLPGAAMAQVFDGAYVSVETFGYSSAGDLGQVTYSGGVQFSFGPGFALSGDLTSYGYETLSGQATSATLHGAYLVNPVATLGAFYGFDQGDDLDRAFYGAEGQTTLGGATIEAFLGQADGDLAEGTMYGLSGQFTFGDFGLDASYAALEDDRAVNRLALAGEWRLGAGPVLFAEWGTLGGDMDRDYLSLGVRIGIGPNAGTTFGPRSPLDIIPGG